MSYKSNIFFGIIFILLIFMYFNNEYLSKIQFFIKFLFIIFGIFAIFFYPLSKKFNGNFNYEEIKKYLQKKYTTKHKI
jgi:hypothetical protein